MVAAGTDAVMSREDCGEGGEHRRERKPDINSGRGSFGWCAG
jgi:hypothetical protein